MGRPIDLSNMDEVEAVKYLQSFMKSGFDLNFLQHDKDINQLILIKAIAVLTSKVNENTSFLEGAEYRDAIITDGERLKRYLSYRGSSYLANLDKLILCN